MHQQAVTRASNAEAQVKVDLVLEATLCSPQPYLLSNEVCRSYNVSCKMRPSCRRPHSVQTSRQQLQRSSKQPSSNMSLRKTCCAGVVAAAFLCGGNHVLMTGAWICSLSNKLEAKTQDSRRISKDFEGVVASQDAGMQTLEVCLLASISPGIHCRD